MQKHYIHDDITSSDIKHELEARYFTKSHSPIIIIAIVLAVVIVALIA